MKGSKAIVIFSGGMDSFTVLHYARQLNFDVSALSFDYGQRHGTAELAAAFSVCRALSIPHNTVNLESLRPLMQGSALTDGRIDVPHGHYAEESMKLTVVPNRNMVMLSIAVANAVSIGADVVFCGVHAGDHAIYPDCRPQFIDAMNGVCSIANYHPVQIVAPFLDKSKGGILQWGLAHGLDYSDTWTCYEGGVIACGKCGACGERLEAFAQNNAQDPIPYRSV